VRRLFIASSVALCLHAILFQISPGWLGPRVIKKIPSRSLALTLSYIVPAEPEIKPIPPSPPIIREKKRPVIKKKEIKKKTPLKKPIVQKKPEKPPQKTKEIKETKEITDKNKDIKEPAPVEAEPSRDAPSPVEEETIDFAAADLEAFSEEHEVLGPIEEPERETHGKAQEIPGPTPPSKSVIVRDAMPLYKINPRPKYPRIARRRGFEGTVLISAFVTHEGKVGKIEIAESSGYSVLDRSALSAVREWLFEPAIKNGKKADMWVKIPVRFELR
jgi:protein TonB